MQIVPHWTAHDDLPGIEYLDVDDDANVEVDDEYDALIRRVQEGTEWEESIIDVVGHGFRSSIYKAISVIDGLAETLTNKPDYFTSLVKSEWCLARLTNTNG